MNHLEAIAKGLKDNRNHSEIVRKVYLTYPTYALVGEEENQFKILDDISTNFSVPIMSIQVTGSAKVGHSFHKKKEFSSKSSDLDIAIIDTALYLKYVEIVFEVTKGYSDRSKFPIANGVSRAEEYLAYLTKGIFRFDLMPSCNERANVNTYFGTLSRQYRNLFKSITGSIYMSQAFFENKQRSAIRNYINYRV